MILIKHYEVRGLSVAASEDVARTACARNDYKSTTLDRRSRGSTQLALRFWNWNAENSPRSCANSFRPTRIPRRFRQHSKGCATSQEKMDQSCLSEWEPRIAHRSAGLRFFSRRDGSLSPLTPANGSITRGLYGVMRLCLCFSPRLERAPNSSS